MNGKMKLLKKERENERQRQQRKGEKNKTKPNNLVNIHRSRDLRESRYSNSPPVRELLPKNRTVHIKHIKVEKQNIP